MTFLTNTQDQGIRINSWEQLRRQRLMPHKELLKGYKHPVTGDFETTRTSDTSEMPSMAGIDMTQDLSCRFLMKTEMLCAIICSAQLCWSDMLLMINYTFMTSWT